MSGELHLSLYDTATRMVRSFEPLVPGQVSMYVCGATPQASPHLGHIRSGVAFDVLRRWLLHCGQQVRYVRNVTDIDDKILTKAAQLQMPWWQLAFKYEREFTHAYEVLGCLPPSIEPRATGHVTEIVELMQRLIDNGAAYAAGGDVYFSVSSFAPYGSLSGQKPDQMQPAGDTDTPTHKRDPRDFALWKAAKPGEPSWPTPWGRGRPGWHVECSAMAGKYLGPQFDIHGGGRDLVFPHHENEIAQSQAAGDGFARYWLHNGWLSIAGEKMSKSLGNSLLVTEVTQRHRPVEVRYYLASAHYRSHQEYSPSALADAAAAYRRIEAFVRRAQQLENQAGQGVYAPELTQDLAALPVPDAFAAALDDDVNVPQALAVLHEVVTEGNSAVAAGDGEAARAAVGQVRAMAAILGVDPLDPHWQSAAGANNPADLALDALVPLLMKQRTQARERKDFAAADAVREALAQAGITVEDTAQGTRWSVNR